MSAFETMKNLQDATMFIARLTDENTTLRYEVEALEEKALKIVGADDAKKGDCVISESEKKYFDELKKSDIEKKMAYNYSIYVIDDETFDEWSARIDLNVPTYMSRDEFIAAHKSYLLAKYEEGKRKNEGGEDA